MSKPRILFVLHLPPPVHGAAQMGKFINESELVNGDFECRYINLTLARSLQDIQKNPLRKLRPMMLLLWHMLVERFRFRPDVIYITPNSHDVPFYKDFIVMLWARIIGPRVVAHFHNKGVATRQDRWLDDKLYRIFFRKLKVVLLSERLYPDIKKYVKRSNVFVCANGIPRIDARRTPYHTPRILFLSNLLRDKGCITVLDVMQRLKERGLAFHCDIGGGETADFTRESYQREIDARGLTAEVTYYGPLYHQFKWTTFGRADIFFFPTRNEAFPLVVLEAMQYKLPIVTSPEGGIPDMVEDGVNGYVCDFDDVEALTQRLTLLLDNPQQRKAMGEESLRRYEEYYTLPDFERRICYSLHAAIDELTEEMPEKFLKYKEEDPGSMESVTAEANSAGATDENDAALGGLFAASQAPASLGQAPSDLRQTSVNTVGGSGNSDGGSGSFSGSNGSSDGDNGDGKPKTSTAGRIIKNTGWLYAKMAVTMFISLWVTRLILGALGATDFGIYGIVGGAIAMLGFLNNAMAGATQRFMNYAEGAGDAHRKTEIFNVSVVIHWGVALTVALVLTLAAFIFFNGVLNIPDDRLSAAYVAYACLIVSTVATIISVPYDAVLNAHENMRYYAFVGVLESLLKLAVAYACVFATSDKLIVYSLLMMLIPITSRTIMQTYCTRHYAECRLAPRRHWSRQTAEEMGRFAGWNFLGSITSLLGNYGMGLVLNHFFGAALNAAQSVAGQVNGQLMVCSNNMIKAVNPVISKSEGAGERRQMIVRATTANKFSFGMLAILAIPVILEARYLLEVWLVTLPDWVVVFTALALTRALIEQLTISYGSAINAEGHVAAYNKVRSINNLLPLVAVTLLFMGGASPVWLYLTGIAFSGIIGGAACVYFMHRNCGMNYHYFVKVLFLPAALSLGIAFGVGAVPVALMEASFLRLCLTTLLSMGTYALAFWYITLAGSERATLLGLLQKFRRK